MILVGKAKIEAFATKHSSSRNALNRWVHLIETNPFRTPQDLKNMFGGNVDFVGTQSVFDVGGNKIRVIAVVQYTVQIMIVEKVLDHRTYDKNKWKK